MTRLNLAVIMGAILSVVMLIGCTGSGSPVIPDNGLSALTGDRYTIGSNSHHLWGLWNISIDPVTLEADIVPLRNAMFTANVTNFMQPPASPTHMISLWIDMGGSEPETGLFAVDVTLRHPFPGLNYYNGFDVRGVFMSFGTVTGDYDSSVIMSGEGDSMLLNPDGYTRFWNWSEFTTYGSILGACYGKKAPPVQPDSTVNPYKYFADGLENLDPVSSLNSEDRGFFAAGNANTRRYDIQFKMDNDHPVFDFNYAVDASWSEPDDSYAPDYPVDAFPLSANCVEAYNVLVEDNESSVWFDGTSGGGSIDVNLEIFDHQGPFNPSGVPGEIHSIWLEGDVLSDPVNVLDTAVILPGSSIDSSVWQVSLSSLNLTYNGPTTIFGTVESADPVTYEPDVSGGELFDYPDAHLAAYFSFDVDIAPNSNALIITSPNGGEVWNSGSSQDITWETGGVAGTVFLEYSKDNFVSDVNTIATNETNDGLYEWSSVPFDPSTTVRVRVSSTLDPMVNDVSDNDFEIASVGPPTEPVCIDPNVTAYGTVFDIASDGVLHSLYVKDDRSSVYWSYSTDLGNTWINDPDPIYETESGHSPPYILAADAISMDANGDYVYCLLSENDGSEGTNYCKVTGGRLDITDLASGWVTFTVWTGESFGYQRSNFNTPALDVMDDGSCLIVALYYYGYGGLFDPSYAWSPDWAGMENITRNDITMNNGSLTYIYPKSSRCLVDDGTNFYYTTGGLLNDLDLGYGKVNVIMEYDPTAGTWYFVQGIMVPNQSATYQHFWARGLTIDNENDLHWVFGYAYNNTGDNNYGCNYGDWELSYGTGASTGNHDFSYQDPITETYHHRSLAAPGYEDACRDYMFVYSNIGVDDSGNVFVVYQDTTNNKEIMGIVDEGSGWEDPVNIEGDSHYGDRPYSLMHDITGYMMISFTDRDSTGAGSLNPYFVAWK